MISVIVCTYNRDKYIYQCLNQLAINITHFDWEIILVNNNSTDNLVSYINDIYNIQKNTSNEKTSADKNYHQVNYLGSSNDNYDKQ